MDPKNVIKKQLETIVHLIVSHSSPRSITISASFAIDEGNIFFYQGEYYPAGDYDLTVVVDKIPSRDAISSLYNDIFKKTKLRNVNYITDKMGEGHNAVEIIFVRSSELRFDDGDLHSYEFLNTYRILYGEDLFRDDKDKASLKKVVPVSVLRFLYNKYGLLLENYNQGKDELSQISYYYTVIKCYYDALKVISFLTGDYKLLAKERIEQLRNNSWIGDKLKARLILFNKMKLESLLPADFNRNELEYVISDLDEIFSIAKKKANCPNKTTVFEQNPLEWTKELTNWWQKYYFKNFFKKTYNIKSDLIAGILNFAINLMEGVQGYRLFGRFSMISPQIWLFGSIISLAHYHYLSDQQQKNEIINYCSQHVKKYLKIDKSINTEEFEGLKKLLLGALLKYKSRNKIRDLKSLKYILWPQ